MASSLDQTRKLIWVTDLHLNHLSPQDRQRWIRELAVRGDDPAAAAKDAVDLHRMAGVVITGDLSEGDDVASCLQLLADAWPCPIFFVLGNHDFYGSSIGRTRQDVIRVARDHPRLHYLTDCDPIELDSGVFVTGDDGWGDATVGDFDASPIRMNDFQRIEDFHGKHPQQWKAQLKALGKESAERLASKLNALGDHAKRIIVATHVPPFRQACWYQGHTTDDMWAPFFVCGAVGECLWNAANNHPETQFDVYCGHTHHGGIAHMRPNLTIFTGKAEYGHPEIADIIDLAH